MTASCAFDEMWSGDAVLEGEEVVMTFNPSFQDFESVTKTIGDGSQVNQLLIHVYEEDSNDAPMVHTYDVESGVVTRTVSIPFFFGKKYEVFFFAYKAGEGSPYTISETGLKGGITVAYPTGSLNYDALEAMDAFYAVKSVDLSQQVESNVALTRPFAQVNLAADKDQLEAAKVAKVEITVSASTSYDFMNGPSNEKDLTFIFKSNDYFANAETLGTTYLFVPSDNAEINATITLYAEGDIELKELSVGIPLELNKRTNLVFSEIEPAGPEGIKISTPEQLEAFLLEGAEEESIAVIAADIDMTGRSLSPVAFKSLELNGNNKTISGLTFSLFDEVTNLKVNNLTIADAAIKGNSHVGALVNTLKGAGTFTNVKVTDSSVSTTGGAVGGIVGYISKSTEKSRKEECSVLFDGCEVNGVTVTGSASEGKFVGLLCGYDNKETVDFTGCSATSVTVADYASVYTSSNQSAWLESLDSKYDGWLGHETYRRGVVKFDGTRLVPRWDGTTVTAKADLLLYNGEANKYEVYSPFDLAGVRNATASPAALYLMENVDMFGQGVDGTYNVPSNWTQSACASEDDKYFKSFSTITYLDGNGKGIYNMNINTQKVSSSLYYGGFIQSTSGTTTHKNINFHNCCVVVPLVVYNNEDKGSAGMLVSNIAGNSYIMDNVNTVGCKIFALQKVGGLAARVAATSATITNCSVNNCYIENYQCKDHQENFSKTASGVTLSASFYSYGEIGGMFGFVEQNVTIDNCKVSKTKVYAFGQDDVTANMSGSGITGKLAVVALKGLGYYKVPGRHVGTFIGNIRTTASGGGTITMTNISVDSETKCTNRADTHNNKCTTVGRAYFLAYGDDEGTVNYNGTKLKLMDCKTSQNRDQ